MTPLALGLLLAAAAVPRFAVEPSPLALSGDVRPHQYVGVLSPRAAWLGAETGEAELWVHPLKLARDFRLAFKVPEYLTPIAGADVARTVEVRPELTTIIYSHQDFSVRQYILAPLGEPGLLVLLEISAARPLQVQVSFQSALQYAWPGGLGGQYAFWDEERRAFVLSESRKQHNGVIGSPWAGSGSSHPAHALPEAPSVFTIDVDPARAAKELVPIAIAGGIASRDEVFATYERLLASAADLYRERVAWARERGSRATAIETPDARLDRAFAWAAFDLEDQRVCNPDLGCGLVAGWGPSGHGARPGFGWFFGGDAAINSLALDALGRFPLVAEGLRFLARHQREDGKLPHEISQAAGRLAWFSDYPYAYYHADTTPFWLLALGRYWRASGDRATLEELWPAARKAWGWCRSADTDGNGLVENTAGGLGAIEVGEIGKDIHEDVYLAAVSVAGARAMHEMAEAMGDAALAREAAEQERKGRETLDERFWIESAGHHAFGVLKDGQLNDTLTVWPATAAAFGLLDAERARRTLEQLSAHAITADWGARMLTTASPLYDPTHYNMGAIWPFVTGFVAWAQYGYGRPWAGRALLDALARMGSDWARGRHPELFSGAFYRPLDEAVPQQFFATSMLVTPLVNGLLGWEPDAPNRRARLAPQLPPEWDRAEVRRLWLGETPLDVRFEQRPGELVATFRADGAPVHVEFRPALPPGARYPRAVVDGTERSAADGVDVSVGREPRTVRVSWQDGLALEAPLADLQPGQTDSGLRILDFRATPDGYTLDVEGLAGHSYGVVLHGEAPAQVAGAEVVERTGTRLRLRVTLPPGEAATSRAHLTLRP